jgi:hypothetical protein
MSGRQLPSRIGLWAGAVGLLFAGACSATGDQHTFTESNGSGGNGNGPGSANGGSGPGVGGAFAAGTAGSGSGTGVGGSCASTSSKAQQIPLDMFIMLDQSGSMSDPAGNGTKWDATTQALTAFVQQPNLAGISVGIQYFGLPAGGMACGTFCAVDADCGSAACGPCFPGGGFPGSICMGATGGDSCNAADYAKAEVEIAPLPGVAQQIITSISGHSPSTGTPTSAALDGAIIHAKDWENAHPGHVTIVVFATDGDPGACDTNLANINAIAAAGANGNPKILTFVIGVGPSLNALNGIASAGGTGQAYLVDTNANAQQQFLDAMNDIRGAALACSYVIPVPTMGTADFNSVNVQYTPGGGGMPEIIPKVGSKAQCPPGGKAWYYDNNATPTQIILCDDTCAQVSADKDGQIDILLGCQTVVN